MYEDQTLSGGYMSAGAVFSYNRFIFSVNNACEMSQYCHLGSIDFRYVLNHVYR